MASTESSSIGTQEIINQKLEEKEMKEVEIESDDLDSDEGDSTASLRAREEAEAAIELEKLAQMNAFKFFCLLFKQFCNSTDRSHFNPLFFLTKPRNHS